MKNSCIWIGLDPGIGFLFRKDSSADGLWAVVMEMDVLTCKFSSTLNSCGSRGSAPQNSQEFIDGWLTIEFGDDATGSGFGPVHSFESYMLEMDFSVGFKVN